ncbi:hypothetical protein HOF78_04170 [Candidatus Woesearchaeota archaeon]|jgi:hypothetical protein|nr:hypothetical protein [Candidatus Woesearchaeota archaeon]MBT6045149.1 hypothetical protein [Candidatus Woesearchaeota archaeon]
MTEEKQLIDPKKDICYIAHREEHLDILRTSLDHLFERCDLYGKGPLIALTDRGGTYNVDLGEEIFRRGFGAEITSGIVLAPFPSSPFESHETGKVKSIVSKGLQLENYLRLTRAGRRSVDLCIPEEGRGEEIRVCYSSFDDAFRKDNCYMQLVTRNHGKRLRLVSAFPTGVKFRGDDESSPEVVIGFDRDFKDKD